MCGIAGRINLDKSPVSIELLEKMATIMAHRGPDDQGIYLEKNVGLSHRRLSIIDLSSAGHQPMANEDKSIVIVHNGEVYNYLEIRKELEKKSYRFKSNTDTEVILRSYEEWGKDCLLKFNGMFAFCIWDKRNKELFLARDRYGIKPLYYYFQNNKFIFASEIKAILQNPEVKAKVDKFALLEYFTFQNIFSERTLFENMKLLPPGNYIKLKAETPSNFRQERWWDYDFREPELALSEEEYIEELNRLFKQAVKRQLIADVPIGSYLSGGIDSAAITSLAVKNIPYLPTFTVGFDLSSASGSELSFDEREKAEFLSHLYKTEHYEAILKAGDLERVMESLVWHLEDLRMGQSYPDYYAAKLASKFVKVILSGAGGDELFGGYPWRYYRAVVNDNFEDYIEKYYRYWQRLIPNRFMPSLFKPETWKTIKDYWTINVFREVMKEKEERIYGPEDYVNRSLYFEIKTFLSGLLLVEDKLSMAHSLEMRLPFLDNDLVDFAMKVPVRYKLRNLKKVVRLNENEPGPKTKKYFEKTRDGKLILRKLMNRYVPPEITNQVKQGFSAPDASWFKGESIDYIRNLLLNKKAKIFNYLQYNYVKKIIEEHSSGKVNHRLLIWSFLSFEWWLRKFMK
ncbi:asparagine synthase (glutamine-hydrolyzing) [Candidatus Desantisbacteria bacterium CG1_02_38_46]|uniref:asparagine synthase (glutamine-hydrolyzing) n=1 Tax=Candidatus Desantisbacteria bacterium CG1_02_38_46 TaxID=1817893 RepID=A0A1J4SCW9_9BACT|nr:MAG: asparagine synthase (glutamine-hydrolyzing) [Candidatus Desantisbacteria bacterium CG1_02_38_46]